MKNEKEKRHKSLNEKKFLFLPLQSGFLTSWLYPSYLVGEVHKDIQVGKAESRTHENRKKSKEKKGFFCLILIFLALNKQHKMLLRWSGGDGEKREIHESIWV